MSYFWNSYDLRRELCSMHYHPTAQVFTADAISMYTNIRTNTAIMLIAKHIQTSIPEVRPKQNEALIAALKLVMLNNIFSFRDMTFKEMNGTAMGTLPAPPYATIYYGLHESKFLTQYQNHVVFYKHFIDNVLGIWPLNLNLYIPPQSAHPPGLLPGIVHSTLIQIFTLCSDHNDRILRTKVFFKRLQARGYKSDHIKPLFYKAIAHAQCYSGPTNRATYDKNTVILHLPFHPNDRPSYKIQQAWRDTIASPKYHMPLTHMHNPKSRGK